MADSKPEMPVNAQVAGYVANHPIFYGDNNPGGNQIQGNFNGPLIIGGTHNTNQNNNQTGGGGNNPQLQRDTVTSSGSYINFGVHQTGGGGNNPQLQRDTVTSSGSHINFGVQATHGVGSKTKK